jgi:hypothetical protein
MSREEIQAQDLKAVEAALASLAPSTGRLDRDRLMYLAGEAAALSRFAQSKPAPSHIAQTVSTVRGRVPLRRWAWPAAFSTMSAVAATLLAMLMSRPEPAVIPQIVYVPVDQPTAVDDSTESSMAGSETPIQVGPRHKEQMGNERRPAEGDYLRLRDQVLALGLDSWSSGRSAGGAAQADAPPSHRQLVEKELESL